MMTLEPTAVSSKIMLSPSTSRRRAQMQQQRTFDSGSDVFGDDLEDFDIWDEKSPKAGTAGDSVARVLRAGTLSPAPSTPLFPCSVPPQKNQSASDTIGSALQIIRNAPFAPSASPRTPRSRAGSFDKSFPSSPVRIVKAASPRSATTSATRRAAVLTEITAGAPDFPFDDSSFQPFPSSIPSAPPSPVQPSTPSRRHLMMMDILTAKANPDAAGVPHFQKQRLQKQRAINRALLNSAAATSSSASTSTTTTPLKPSIHSHASGKSTSMSSTNPVTSTPSGRSQKRSLRPPSSDTKLKHGTAAASSGTASPLTLSKPKLVGRVSSCDGEVEVETTSRRHRRMIFPNPFEDSDLMDTVPSRRRLESTDSSTRLLTSLVDHHRNGLQNVSTTNDDSQDNLELHDDIIDDDDDDMMAAFVDARKEQEQQQHHESPRNNHRRQPHKPRPHRDQSTKPPRHRSSSMENGPVEAICAASTSPPSLRNGSSNSDARRKVARDVPTVPRANHRSKTARSQQPPRNRSTSTSQRRVRGTNSHISSRSPSRRSGRRAMSAEWNKASETLDLFLSNHQERKTAPRRSPQKSPRTESPGSSRRNGIRRQAAPRSGRRASLNHVPTGRSAKTSSRSAATNESTSSKSLNIPGTSPAQEGPRARSVPRQRISDCRYFTGTKQGDDADSSPAKKSESTSPSNRENRRLRANGSRRHDHGGQKISSSPKPRPSSRDPPGFTVISAMALQRGERGAHCPPAIRDSSVPSRQGAGSKVVESPSTSPHDEEAEDQHKRSASSSHRTKMLGRRPTSRRGSM